MYVFAARVVTERKIHKHTHTHTQNDYYNPCAEGKWTFSVVQVKEAPLYAHLFITIE